MRRYGVTTKREAVDLALRRLVDTSAWIDFLRASDTAVAAELTGLIVAGEDLATTEAVVMELLAGADIASVALRHDVPLLHRDADYAAIASCLPLRIHPVGRR